MPEKSYSGLLTTWFGTRYAKVEARNMGFSGTGSEFADFRFDHDLGSFVPDLAFIEFTVNDAGASRAQIFAHVDALVYKLRKVNPQVKIIYISTTDIVEEPQRRAGGHASFVDDSIAVANFEEIPFVDASTGMWAKVIAGAPVTTFMTDSVHPNDAGHELYFEAIRDAIDPIIPLATQPSRSGSKLIAQSKLDTARFEPTSAANGCHAETSTTAYMENTIVCDLGDSFTYHFSGTTLGVLRMMTKDGGRLECSVDGTNPLQIDFYDSVVRYWERPYPYILYHNLSDGGHDLTCHVTSDVISLPEGTSTGHKAMIGAFLVSSEQPVTLP